MLISNEEFNELFNRKLFENNVAELINKIVMYPDRYVGIFRPTKPHAKLLQNLSQSLEIRFGDCLEQIFEIYLERSGFELMDKKIDRVDNFLSVDLLFKDHSNKKIYMVEQKVRDDHDSTKKRGQYINFSEKYELVEEENEGYDIVAIMWFIDDSLMKNKKYYKTEIEKETMAKSSDVMHLVYGEEFFTTTTTKLEEISFWNEFVNSLIEWKKSIPDLPEVNFDKLETIEETVDQLLDVSVAKMLKLFSNNQIREEILPIIFPSGNALNLYMERKNLSVEKIREKELQVAIKNYISK